MSGEGVTNVGERRRAVNEYIRYAVKSSDVLFTLSALCVGSP